MRSPRRIITAIVPLLVVAAGCGTTYVDESLVTSTSAVAVTTTVVTAPVSNRDDVVVVLDRIADAMDQLSDAIVDDAELATRLLAAIDADWRDINAWVRAESPTDLFGFEQVVSLAHSAVEGRRPADASKGWKLLIDLNADVASR